MSTGKKASSKLVDICCRYGTNQKKGFFVRTTRNVAREFEGVTETFFQIEEQNIWLEAVIAKRRKTHKIKTLKVDEKRFGFLS
jgi:hypothetical protein